MKKSQDLFWGILFVLAAVYLIASGLGYGPEVGLFKIFVTVILVFICVKGMVRIDFPVILFSLAFLSILYEEQLHIEAITPWGVLGAAFLGSIGLSMIFKKRRHRMHHHTSGTGAGDEVKFNTVIDNDTDSYVKCEVNFGSIIKYIKSDDFKQAEIDCNFGGATIYFDQAMIRENQANVSVDVNFSGVKLYFPKEWKIVNQIHTTLGGVDVKQPYNGEVAAKTVYLTGDVTFGGVEIYYV